LANLVLFAICNHWDQVREQRMAERGVMALVYFHQHSYLALKPPLDEFVSRNDDAEGRVKAADPTLAVVGSFVATIGRSPAPSDSSLVRRQQAELDAKVGAFAEVADQWQGSNLGYVPRARLCWTLLSYQFMHASWWHLLGNLCFLWLVGSRLERSWGHVVFAAFYLASGVAAAGAHHLLAASSLVPLVGASGSIAGLLGAYVLQQVNATERLVRAPRWSFQQLRAPLLLVGWFALELIQAIVSLHRHGGVAHFAHVGGFAFGLAGAWLLRLTCTLAAPAPDQTGLGQTHVTRSHYPGHNSS
jgi:membrane associated rhomboid family serine protease